MSLHRQMVHPDYVEGCFGCKVGSLQLSTGDANSRVPSAKGWDKRLQAYRDATAQGVEPRGTDWKSINQAMQVSEKVGKAYDGVNNTFKD